VACLLNFALDITAKMYEGVFGSFFASNHQRDEHILHRPVPMDHILCGPNRIRAQQSDLRILFIHIIDVNCSNNHIANMRSVDPLFEERQTPLGITFPVRRIP
jgi:hypothetical protein